jgi:hypothetical protein
MLVKLASPDITPPMVIACLPAGASVAPAPTAIGFDSCHLPAKCGPSTPTRKSSTIESIRTYSQKR